MIVTGEDWFTQTFGASTPEGERNETATRMAGFLLGRGLRAYQVRAVLTDWARRCHPSFALTELDCVITSIAEREAARNGGPALRLHAPSTLAVQEIRFTVDALIPAATLTLLYGVDKIGKTLLALETVRSVLTGAPLFGHFAASRGGVIALLLDDPPGLVRERLVENLRLGDDGLWVATHLDCDTDRPKTLLEALAAEAQARQPALIVVDALYVLLEGAEQLHLAGGMRPLMRALDRIAEESGAAVVLIHHPRKSDEQAAGSFVIRASAKSILRLSRPSEVGGAEAEADTGRRLLRVEGKYLPEATYMLDFDGPGRWTLLGEAAAVRGQEVEAALLDAIQREPGLTADELAHRVGRRKGDLGRMLSRLAQDGRLQSREVRSGGRGRPRRTWWLHGAATDFELPPGAL